MHVQELHAGSGKNTLGSGPDPDPHFWPGSGPDPDPDPGTSLIISITTLCTLRYKFEIAIKFPHDSTKMSF